MSDIFKIRKERMDALIQLGYTGNIETGKVYNRFGKEVDYVEKNGYMRISSSMNNIKFKVQQHQFIYYLATGEVVEEIDHINRIRHDNRIENLRGVTQQQNHWNRVKTKGYTWEPDRKKWKVLITINGKQKCIARFNLEDEHLARQCYLDAKAKYHII